MRLLSWSAFAFACGLVAVGACSTGGVDGDEDPTGEEAGNETGGIGDNGGSAKTGGSGGTASTGGAAGKGGTTVDAGRESGVTGGASGTGGAAATGGSTGTGGTVVLGPSCKRGMAYGHHSAADMKALKPGVTWWYNWSDRPDTGIDPAVAGLEYVPMLWNGNFDPQTVISRIKPGTKYILGFNEPNFNGQANLTPTAAAALWPKVEQIAKAKNLKIVGPAVNHCGGGCNQTDPFIWLEQFLAACKNCQIDYLAFHFYACKGDYLAGELGKYTSKFPGKQFWVTEFACMEDPTMHTSTANQLAFLKSAVANLEQNINVFRYSWFTGRWDGPEVLDLFNAGAGSLNELGTAYVSARGKACQ